MIDPSLALSEIGKVYMGGKGPKAVKRVILSERIPYQKINGSMFVKQSAMEQWRESKTLTPQEPTLKMKLQEIRERVLQKRRA